MKKFSILLCLGAAVLSLASCNREQLVPDGLYTITASREGDAATKTYVGDGLSLVWASGDKIGVFNGNYANNAYTLSSGDDTPSAEFSAETPFTEGALHAYYPYSDDNTNLKAIVVDLRDQTYSEPSDFGKYFYMVGSADVKASATDINIGFKNPLAAFVFTVNNKLDHEIKVTGFSVSTQNSETVFHKEATLDLTAEAPTKLDPSDDPTNEISVTIKNIEVAAREEVAFPLVVLPADLTDKKLDFTFSYTSNGESKTVTKSVIGKNISRNTFITGTFTLEESTIGGDIEGSWDGTSVSEPETDGSDANVYYIKSAAELAWVAQQVNGKKDNFEGKTLLLTNDINLNGHYWTPIGKVESYPGITFRGTFDGQNHTISNLTASDNAKGYAAAGLFGSLIGTVKNVTLKNVDIRSTHYAGAVVAYSSTNGATVENCHVDGGMITSVPEYTGSAYDNGDKAGGIIGYYVTDDKVTSCTAKNLTITAYRDLGGIVGSGPQSGMTDCSVENITLVQDNTNGYETKAVTTIGALGGRDVTKGDQPYDGEFASKVTKKVVGNISDAQNLINALTNGISDATITLAGDIQIPDQTLIIPSGTHKILNLNQHSLNLDIDEGSAILVLGGSMTINNGTINSNNYTDIANGGIATSTDGVLVVDNVIYNTSGNGFFVENNGNLTIRNSTVTAPAYAVSTNASDANQNITVLLEGSTFKATTTLFFNIPSDITINDCNVYGTTHGMMVRGGTAVVSNTEIILEYTDDDYETIGSYFDNQNWGTGNRVNVSALTIGNKGTNAYQYPTNVTLKGCTVSSIGKAADYLPAVYAYANSGEGLGVTFTYDDACTFNGQRIYGSTNITVNGTPVKDVPTVE